MGKTLSTFLAFVWLASCQTSPEMRRFEREYDWTKPAGRTPHFQVQVAFPSWLTSEADRQEALLTVDDYVGKLCYAYPSAAGLWWADVRVYLHEAIGEKIVSSWPPIWAYGWQLGRRVYTPWRPLYALDGKTITGINPKDTFMVIPHELFHIIGAWETKRSLAGFSHAMFTAEMEAAIQYSRSNVRETHLSEAAVSAALARLPYIPWIQP